MRCRTVSTLVVMAGLSGLGGCAGGLPQETADLAPTARPVALSQAATKDVARRMSRSIWGVVPAPPRRKADLRPSMIRGSAVAVGEGTLLASCAVVDGRRRVGLVRHNKYRQATVTRLATAPGVCALRAPDAPLNLPASLRAAGDVAVGETVLALSSRTAADLALSSGRVTAIRGGARPRLDTDIARVPGSSSVVFLDLDGNLIGLGPLVATGSTPMSALPVPAAAAPVLLVRTFVPVPVRLASARATSPLPLRAAPDRDDDPAGSLPDEVAVSRVDPDPTDGSADVATPPDRDDDVATPADRGRPRGRSVGERIGAALGLDRGRGRDDDRDEAGERGQDRDGGRSGRGGRGSAVGDGDDDDDGRGAGRGDGGRGIGGRAGDAVGGLGGGRGRGRGDGRDGDDDGDDGGDDDGGDGDDGGDDD